ncbi:MAG: glycosyltransferase family 39 protein, partial [Actinomycetes bacterium]
LGVTGVLQAVIAGVAVLATFVVGARLGGRRVGLIAAAVLALWPNFIVYSGLVLSETLFVACFAVALAALLTMCDDGRWHAARVATAVIAVAAAMAVRPQLFTTLPALVAAWVLCRVGWRSTVGRTAVLVAGVLLFTVPWAIRNERVFHAFVPFSTNGGDNLCVGFHPGATGGFSIPRYCDTGEFYVDGPAAELRRDRETRRRAVAWIR